MKHIASPEYFNVAAQVIPVIMLAILVEGRMDLTRRDEDQAGRHRRPSGRQALRRLWNLGIVCLGEAMALRAVAGHPTVADTVVVTEVLGVLAAILLWPFMENELDWIRDTDQPWFVAIPGVAFAVAIVLALTGPGLVLAWWALS
jgi:hypothetical protein